MKSDTIFINISREPLIDESALIDALLKNGIAGAGGLEVFSEETVRLGNPLLESENIILTPQTAAMSKESASKGCGFDGPP
jgi:phosphoglycerate dehydrogenase-like enzyme